MRFKQYKLLFCTFLMMGCQQNSGNTQTGNPFSAMAMTGSNSAATALNNRNRSRSLWDLFVPTAIAYPAPTSMFDSNNNSVQLNQNWISVGELEFKSAQYSDSGETDGSDVDFRGPYSVNLFSSSPQALASNSISVGQIRRIKMKLSRSLVLPSGAPSGFLGKSMYISGTVNGNSFSFATAEETEIQIAGPSSVAPVESKTLLVELQTANLIRKINLSAITSTTVISDSNRVSTSNPCPAIDSSAHDLFTCFRKGFASESNLGRDDDGNFKIDNYEDSVK